MTDRIVLLGASGYTGRLVAEAFERRGLAFQPAGRDPDRVARAVEHLTHASGPVACDVTDPAQLRALLESADLVITTVGPFVALGRAVATAAVATGTHYVDSTGEQPFLAWIHDELAGAAVEAGVSLVPAAGFDSLPGDALAALAADQVAEPREVHVAYAVPGVRPGAASTGTRRSLAGLLGEPVLTVEGGDRVAGRLGEARRLAWFPRPVGPRHAAGIPGGEPITVPRHVPGVTTVRTYASMSTAAAELVQMVGNVARWEPTRRLLQRVVTPRDRGSGGPDPAARARTRWACVAEVAGAHELGRAWAYGTDPYGLAAEALVTVATTVLAGGVAAGVLAPAEVGAPGPLLDDLAARSDLRWSRARTEHQLG